MAVLIKCSSFTFALHCTFEASEWLKTKYDNKYSTIAQSYDNWLIWSSGIPVKIAY